MQDRIDFNEDGTLDEVVAAGGAHLEHLGGKRWYLNLVHADGTSSVFWFKSKTLKVPFWGKRPAAALAAPPVGGT
jgi:hypothetical protein